MIKKRLAAALVSACMLVPACASAKTLEISVDNTDVYVSDQTIEMIKLDSAPYIENGRTMVPVRFITENFNASVEWSEPEQKVTVKSGDNTVELFIGNTAAYVNGETKELDAPPAIVNSRTMVPLRFISEAFNKTVEYIEVSKQIRISDIPPVLNVNGKLFTIDDYKFVMLSYGLPNTPEYIEQVASDVTQYLAQIGSVCAEAEKSENALLEDSSMNEEAIAKTVIENKESILPNALTSTAIKFTLLLNRADEFIEKASTDFSDEDIEKIYKDEYVRAKHILVSTIDTATGAPLSDADKDKAEKTAKEVLKKAKKGEDFDKLIQEYNEDPGMSYNPDGYVFTKNEMVKEFETAAFELKENEISDIVETSYGYHIIQKLPLTEISEDVKAKIANGIASSVVQQKVGEIVENAEVSQYVTNEVLIEYLMK